MAQAQHAHEYQGVVLFFFIGYRSQGNGTGDVGGSLVILSAGIHQVQASCLQARAMLRHCMIMAQRRIFPICRDGGKADIQRTVIPAHLIQAVGHAALIHRDLSDVFLQPVNILGHDYAIGDVGLLHIFNLGRILLGFGVHGRIHLVDDLVLRLHVLINGEVYTTLLQKYGVVFQLVHIRVNVIIRTDGYTQRLQISTDFIGDHLRIYIKEQVLFSYHQIRQHHRIARNVIAADI